MTYSLNFIDKSFDDAWSTSEIRDLIETTPLMFDADGLPCGYDAEQLFGLEAAL